MKCSVLTFHFAHNYGAMLQTYALKHFLEEQGYEASIVDYASSYMFRGYHPRLRSYFKPTNWGWLWRQHHQADLFENFYREQLGCCETTANYAQAISAANPDVLLVGSDQVWNDRLTQHDEAYFKPWQKGRTIAYAASFGRSHLTDWQAKEVRGHLSDFDYLSVREPEGAAEVRRLIDKEVLVVLDPVFLLPKEYWLSVARPAASVAGDYILYYSLRNDQRLIALTKQLAKLKNLPILAIHPQCIKQKVGMTLKDVGPLEFLSLIKNAQYVCANSFHAAAFSVLFGTKLVQVPISTQETRVTSLLERIGATSVYCEEEHCYDLGRLNPMRLNEAIQVSKDYLTHALEK